MIEVSVKHLEKEKQELEYPCCMKHFRSNAIVLFGSCSCGVVLVYDEGCGGREMGHYANDWYMPAFEPFKGTITIEVT